MSDSEAKTEKRHKVTIKYDGSGRVGHVMIDDVEVPNVIQVNVRITTGTTAVLFEMAGVDIEIETTNVPGENIRTSTWR